MSRLRFEYMPKDRMLARRRTLLPGGVLVAADLLDRLALGVWLGSLVAFACVFAPAVFAVRGDAADAGTLIAVTLARLGIVGYACALLAALCTALRLPARREAVRLALIALACAVSLFSQQSATARMSAIAHESGGITRLPAADPRRVAWEDLHRRSLLLFGTELLVVAGALSLAGRRGED